MQNLSYENDFDLHLNGLVSKTYFHMKGFALGLVLKQRQRELENGQFTPGSQQLTVASKRNITFVIFRGDIGYVSSTLLSRTLLAKKVWTILISDKNSVRK